MNPVEIETIARDAWDKTREDSDPEFAECAYDHQGKLKTAVASMVEAINDTPGGPSVPVSQATSGIVGLEAFEAEAKKALTRKALPEPEKPKVKGAK